MSVSGESIGKMPPLEALRSPNRLKMDRWSEKRTEWQDAVNKSLALLATEPDCFQELERVKQIALDCARTVLGTTGGKGLRIIPHHSKEARRLKARLTLLRVVRREVHARKEQGSGFVVCTAIESYAAGLGLWTMATAGIFLGTHS